MMYEMAVNDGIKATSIMYQGIDPGGRNAPRGREVAKANFLAI
jgi:hypothetical protein